MNLLKPHLIIIRSLLFILFDSIALWAAKVPKHNQLKLILLIRQDRIGDFILWLDTAKEYRKYYPPENYKIILIGNAIWSDLAKGLPFWDEVLPVNVKAFKALSRYRWNILRKVRNFGANIAIQPTYSREFYHGDSLIRASNAYKKVSSAGNMSNRDRLKKWLANRWHTELIPATTISLTELERNAEFFSCLSGEDYHCIYPKLNLPKSMMQQLHEGDFFYVLVPGASTNLKKWPPECFAKLAEKIFRHTNWPGIICGTQKEHLLSENILKHCNAPLKNMSGQTSLPELVRLLDQCQITISNDTGTAHISSAVETKTLCVLGGGHFGRFAPYPEISGGTNSLKVVYHKMPCYGCNWECIYHIKEEEPAPCISNISIDAVWKEVEKIIEAKVN